MTVFHIDIHPHNDVYEIWLEEKGNFWLMEYLFKPTKMKVLNDSKISTNLRPASNYDISRLRPLWEAFVARHKIIS